MVSVISIEWRNSCRGILGIVVDEFGEGKELIPIVLLIVTKDAEVIVTELVLFPDRVNSVHIVLDKAKSPENQPHLIALYNESFAFHKNNDPNGKNIHLSPRILDVCWTKCSPEGDVLWGNIDIGKGELELMTIEDCASQQILQAIRLGIFNGFPLTNLIVFYCCEPLSSRLSFPMLYHYGR